MSLFSQMMQLQVNHSEIYRSQQECNEHVNRIVPVYNLTAGLYQSQVRSIVKTAIKTGKKYPQDVVPIYIKERLNLMDLHLAIDTLHYPQTVDGYQRACVNVLYLTNFLFINYV